MILSSYSVFSYEILYDSGLPRLHIDMLSENGLVSVTFLCPMLCFADMYRYGCVSSSCELGTGHNNSIPWRETSWSWSNCDWLQEALQNFPLLQTFSMQRCKNSYFCSLSKWNNSKVKQSAVNMYMNFFQM